MFVNIETMAAAAHTEALDLTACESWENDPKSPNNPRTSDNFRFLIITLGPTGSGKSGMAGKLKSLAKGINSAAYRHEWFEKVIDDYVEESDYFKGRMSDLIFNHDKFKHIGEEEIKTLDGCSIYQDTWKELTEEMNKIYFDARETGGIVQHYNAEFARNLSDGKNIVFEITGRNKLTIIEALNTILSATNNCKTHKYIILCGYSIVDYYILQARNISRFRQSFLKFKADPAHEKPPRLPWVGCFSHKTPGTSSTIISYCEMLNAIKNTLFDLLSCGHYLSNREVKRTTAEGECYLDKTTPVEAARPINHRPQGLYVDLLYIFNNIYSDQTLMAKINISERSVFLENPTKPLNYYKLESLETIKDIIIKTGPPSSGDGGANPYNLCGTGIPIPTSFREPSSKKYSQNFNLAGGSHSGRKKKTRTKRKHKRSNNTRHKRL